MSDHIGLPFFLYAYRLHHATAHLEPVSRVFIYMFRPKAYRAMIGIAVTGNLPAAMSADEILYSSSKSFNHFMAICRGAGIRTRSHLIPSQAC